MGLSYDVCESCGKAYIVEYQTVKCEKYEALNDKYKNVKYKDIIENEEEYNIYLQMEESHEDLWGVCFNCECPLCETPENKIRRYKEKIKDLIDMMKYLNDKIRELETKDN